MFEISRSPWLLLVVWPPRGRRSKPKRVELLAPVIFDAGADGGRTDRGGRFRSGLRVGLAGCGIRVRGAGAVLAAEVGYPARVAGEVVCAVAAVDEALVPAGRQDQVRDREGHRAQKGQQNQVAVHARRGIRTRAPGRIPIRISSRFPPTVRAGFFVRSRRRRIGLTCPSPGEGLRSRPATGYG